MSRGPILMGPRVLPTTAMGLALGAILTRAMIALENRN